MHLVVPHNSLELGVYVYYDLVYYVYHERASPHRWSILLLNSALEKFTIMNTRNDTRRTRHSLKAIGHSFGVVLDIVIYLILSNLGSYLLKNKRAAM